MDRIGIGIIGARFAVDLHIRALEHLRGSRCEVVAVCSETKESAEAFAKRFSIPHVYTDHRALLERKDIQLVWGDEYITEKVGTKGGWQFPSPDEDWMRGYPQEMEDFVDAVRLGREPLSSLLLAHETVEVIYAGSVSAQEGRRVDLQR